MTDDTKLKTSSRRPKGCLQGLPSSSLVIILPVMVPTLIGNASLSL